MVHCTSQGEPHDGTDATAAIGAAGYETPPYTIG
jgi:hypothetical protein